MIQNLRFALRLLRKQWGFSLIAIFTLALGIGATSAVFSLIQGVLLSPPPYRQPERLVLIPSARRDGQPTVHPRAWARAQWSEWQRQTKAFESIAAYGWSFNFLVFPEGSESIEGMWVTRQYFGVTGLTPLLGRTFLASEVGANPPPVIILGYEFWQRKFNGDPNILGKTVRISRQETLSTIVGVMPPGIRFLPSPGQSQEPNYNVNALVDFWIPAAADPKGLNWPIWDVVGRLRPGATIQQAEAELTVLADRQARTNRDFEDMLPRVQSLSAEMNRDGRRILLPLLGAAALVLLIACGNSAALLLVRGLQRQQEYSVRSALGMNRMALLRMASTEGLLLALIGGTLGITLAFGAVQVFKIIGGHAVPRLDTVKVGWPVLAYGLGSAILAAVLSGLFPAFRASGLDPNDVLKSAGPKSSAGRGERRILYAVTMAQTALTLSLLVGASLLVRTMINLSEVQSGYDTARILTMSVTAVQGNWVDFHQRALQRISSLPGVQRAAFAWGVPLTGNSWPATVEMEGRAPAIKESDRIALPLRAVTPDYFDVLGAAISEGRNFRSTDANGAPAVAIVNKALVDKYFSGNNAIGRKLWLGGRDQPPTQVVGVVTNSRTDDLTQSAKPEIYLSLWQAHAFSKSLVIRTTVDPRSIRVAVQQVLRSVDPTVAVENVKTLEEIRGDSLASRTFAMRLLVGFSLVGSVLTLVGIYGVLSLSVASRRREIAIRAAIGAGEHDIRNLVFAEGFRVVAGGVVIGIAIAVFLSRALGAFLYGVQPEDPLTLSAVCILFAGTALLACWVPVRRAMKIDPLEALRYAQ